MQVQLEERRVRHEIALDFAPTPAWVWAAVAALCLAFPRLAATGETGSATGFYATPSGASASLNVVSDAWIGRSPPPANSASAMLVPAFSAGTTGGYVGIGTSSPMFMFHVAGHVKLGGCFWLGATARCKWYGY